MTSTPTLPTVNPYDFANPVDTKDMFVGRTKEIDEILYYLNHAATSSRSISLALLGDRAAGKTSLLNIIAIEATRLNLIPVRIDLNTSDATSPLAFWFKAFDAIFTTLNNTVSPSGSGYLFGGVEGRTYNTYQDVIASYKLPSDATFCPCQFPLHYARVMAAGNPNAPLSEMIIQRDLSRLSHEAGRPIVLLFDECNVLSQHRPLLEMLRNTFMNLRGYMLVLTGTPDLFPVMDEVFSPIIRQFKRIVVAPFTTPEETLDVIRSPLERLNAANLFPLLPEAGEHVVPKEYWHFSEQLRDIHALTAGKPYEIQLICHIMFKRVQLGKAKVMKLTHDVLDDVLRELEGTHTPDRRSMITSVLSLADELLMALSVLVKCGTAAGVDATLSAAYAVGYWHGDYGRLTLAINELVNAGIITAEGDTLRYNGNDYDKIFCKYAARSRKVSLDFTPVSPGELIDRHIAVTLIGILNKQFNDGGGYRFDKFSPLLNSDNLVDPDKARTLHDFISDGLQERDLLSFVRRCPGFVPEIYGFCIKHSTDNPRELSLIAVDFHAGRHKWHGVYVVARSRSDTSSSIRLREVLESMAKRSAEAGARFAFNEVPLGNCVFGDIVAEALKSECDEVVAFAANAHAQNAVTSYLEENGRGAAVEHAGVCVQVAEKLADKEAGNVAYILISAGRYDEASQVLLPRCGSGCSTPLLLYNFGLSCLMRKKFSDARVAIARAISLMTRDIADGFMVLLSPQLRDGAIHLEEVWHEQNDRTEKLADADGLLAVMLDAGKLAKSLEQPALGDGPGQ
jgi:hypothetical protein